VRRAAEVVADAAVMTLIIFRLGVGPEAGVAPPPVVFAWEA